MVKYYPCFDNKEIRIEYSYKINKIFQERNFKWDSLNAAFSPNIFVKPGKYSNPRQLNAEHFPFKDVARISVNTKDGILRIGIIAYPSINDSISKKILENRGYVSEKIESQPNLLFFVKPINDLEAIVDELENINSVLLKI
jgi:hypothetical protein